MKSWMGCGVLGLVAGILVLILLVWGVTGYNRLVRLDNGVEGAWAQVENVYQRRLDLIPNLVETVKGVANFEKETYTAVAEARAKASQISMTPGVLDDPARLRQFQEAQGEVSSALSRLLVTVERYPDLKANQSFLELQSQLESTENRIAVERRRFNEVVVDYNNAVRVFPARILAGMFGFAPKPLFEAEAGAEKAPKVKF